MSELVVRYGIIFVRDRQPHRLASTFSDPAGYAHSGERTWPPPAPFHRPQEVQSFTLQEGLSTTRIPLSAAVDSRIIPPRQRDRMRPETF